MRLLISQTDMPGLVNATLVDAAGAAVQSFSDLTTGQVHSVASTHGAAIVPVR